VLIASKIDLDVRSNSIVNQQNADCFVFMSFMTIATNFGYRLVFRLWWHVLENLRRGIVVESLLLMFSQIYL